MRKLMQKPGRIALFDGPADMVREVVEYVSSSGSYDSTRVDNNKQWMGRHFDSWKDIEKKFFEPWPEGMNTVQDMMRQINEQDLPEPRDVRRRQHWNEEHGELNVDRYMAGDDMIFRRGMRKSTSAPKVVSLLCCLGGNCNVSAESMFWRGAAAAAAVQKLEEAGYSCEVIAYMRSVGCYSGNYDQTEAFQILPIKQAGEELDLASLVNCMSGWFFRSICFGGLYTLGRPRRGLGSFGAYTSNYDGVLNPTAGIQIQMPITWDKKSTVDNLKDLINKVSEEALNAV